MIRMLLIITALAFAGCAATKQPSLFDTHSDLLTKQHTPDQIKAIEQNFNANPLQYSQELGNLLLWQMYKKSPEFALEFAQTPELNDGINPQEAKAMMSIYNLIKDIDMPPDLFDEKAEYENPTLKLTLEWHGNSKEKEEWSGWPCTHGFRRNILDAKPIGFEPGEDRINYEHLKKGFLKWYSMSSSEDKDGIIITVERPIPDEFAFEINGQWVFLTRKEILSKSSLLFDENDYLNGALTIKSSRVSKLKPELYALRDMVLAGEGDYRCSSPLRAMLEKYKIGDLKEGDNPFKEYSGLVEFVKSVWDDMKGEEWKKFGYVESWVNHSPLVHYYIDKNYTYTYNPITVSPYVTFLDKEGNCCNLADLGEHFLKKAGRKTFVRSVKWGSDPCHDWHTGSGEILEDGSFLLAVDFGKTGNRTGIYKTLSDLDKVLNRGGGETIGRMWGHPPGCWY